jgi:TolC family type I secretion outer membrane protein
MHPRSLILILAPFVSALAPEAIAFGSIDPFSTEAITPPRAQLAPMPESNFVPCQTIPSAAVFDVLEVVDLALCQNPGTYEAWANARVQAALVGVAQSVFLPGLDGNASVSRLRSEGDTATQRSASLTLSWLLYDFGARSANLENARQLLSAAASTLDATVQTVFLNALQSYYNAQAARAAVTAALESEKASRESLSAAEVRYRVGTGTPADRLQAQTAWSQAALNRIKAEGVLKTAFGTLANVMGLDASLPLRLADIPDTLPAAAFERDKRDIEALIAEARERRPDLRAAEAQLKAAQSTVDFTRSSGLPTLSLGTGPAWQGSSGNAGNFSSHSSSIGLTLTLPIFSGFNTTYKVRSAQARAEVAGAQRDSLRLQVALDVWTSYQSLTTASQTISTSADLLASAEQSERVALGRYKAGVGSILDVLNAQSALAAARLQRIQAMLDWRVARAALAKSVGTLDSSLLNPAGSTKP